MCGQNVEFVNVKPGGTYSYHWALEGLAYTYIGHMPCVGFYFCAALCK